MAVQTNEELLAQLRAIGWTDSQIARDYPDLLPYYGSAPPSTLWERLIMIGWTEEMIRAAHPEILPESEGGIVETVGEPVYTLGEQAGEPIKPTVGNGFDPGSGAAPYSDPFGYPTGEVPPIESNQTADLFALGLLFL